MRAAITCAACGAKVRADRDRCPRCRARIVRESPAVAVESTRRLKMAAGVIVGLFGAVLLGLWITREPAASAPGPAQAGDPLAARRAAAPAPRAATEPEAPEAGGDRDFLEAPGAGAVAYAAGDYEAALARYREAVEKNPQDAESLSNLGQVLVRLKRPAEALPYFERAIEILPGRWAYQFNLARALGLVGRTDEAIAAYRRAQGLFPDDYATAFNLAMALHTKGDEAGAVEQYRKAIALQPEDASFRKALGISYERLQRGPDAAAAYTEYLRLSPSAPDADAVRARIARLQGGAEGAPPAPGGPPAPPVPDATAR